MERENTRIHARLERAQNVVVFDSNVPVPRRIAAPRDIGIKPC